MQGSCSSATMPPKPQSVTPQVTTTDYFDYRRNSMNYGSILIHSTSRLANKLSRTSSTTRRAYERKSSINSRRHFCTQKPSQNATFRPEVKQSIAHRGLRAESISHFGSSPPSNHFNFISLTVRDIRQTNHSPGASITH